MFLVSIALSIFYKPHPSNVMEMLDYIENLPDTIRDGKFPERPGQLTAQTMNRRPDHLELFCPMTGDYYLETWIDEDNRLNASAANNFRRSKTPDLSEDSRATTRGSSSEFGIPRRTALGDTFMVGLRS